MQKNLSYFFGRNNNPKFKNKPCYVENHDVTQFCDRLIYCLNRNARENFKKAFKLQEKPDFVCIFNCSINDGQASIQSRDSLKTSYVLFKFNKENKPRIIRRHDGSFRGMLKQSQYVTFRKERIYPTGEFTGLLFAQDYLKERNLDPNKSYLEDSYTSKIQVPLHSY